MSGQQPQWKYDPRRKLQYWYDSRTGEFVYQDGRRISATQTEPRSVPTAHQAAFPLQAHSQYGHQFPSPTGQHAYIHQGAHSPYQQAQGQAESLAASMSGLGLGQPQYHGQYQPQVPFFDPQVYQQNGIRMVTATNPAAEVRTNIGTTPKERITDPILLARGIQAHRILIGTSGNVEPLYPAFKLQKPEFFALGRVFRVLWAEPAGETRTLVTDIESSDRRDPAISTGRHNEKVYSKVRRFVVVRVGEQYCSALPVMSYGHRGVGKPGVVKHEHAIIYTGAEPPDPLPEELPGRGELPMRPDAIRVTPDHPAEKLDPMSRIDFLRVHTVQHNIKAKSFGMVHPNSMQALTMQFLSVWIMSISPSNPLATASQSPPVSQAAVEASRRTDDRSSQARRLQRSTQEDEDEKGDEDGDEEDDEGQDDDDDEEEDDDDDDDGEGDEEDDEDDEAAEGSIHPRTASRAPSSNSAGTHTSQNVLAAKQANEAIERLRKEGYTADQAFVIVMAKLQTDRNITREEAYRLLHGWTGYRPTSGSSAASTTASRMTIASGSSSHTTRQAGQQSRSSQYSSQQGGSNRAGR